MNSEDRGKIVEYFHEIEVGLPKSSRLDGNFMYNMLKSFIYALSFFGLFQMYCAKLEMVDYLSCLFLGFALLMYLVFKPVFQYRYFMSKRFMARSGIIQSLIVSHSKQIVADHELIQTIIIPLCRIVVSGMDGITSPFFLDELYIATLINRSGYDAKIIRIQNDAVKMIFTHTILHRTIIRSNHFKPSDKLLNLLMDYLLSNESLDLLPKIDQCRVFMRKAHIYKLLNQSDTFKASELIDKFDQLSEYLHGLSLNQNERLINSSEQIGINSKL